MLDTFAKQILGEAEKRTQAIIREAREEFEKTWAAREKEIDEEYRQRLEREKESIRRDMQSEIAQARVEAKKEALGAKNESVQDVLQNVGERFRKFLRRDLKKIVTAVAADEDLTDCSLLLSPDLFDDTGITGLETKQDDTLKEGFILRGPHWQVRFSWDTVREAVREELVTEITKHLYS